MEREALRIVLAQRPIVWTDPEANLRLMAEDIRTAAEGGAHLVVFPEVMLTGFNLKVAQSARPWQGAELERLRALAQEHQIAIASSAFVWDDETQQTHYYNRAYIMLPDGSIYAQDKRHLFSMAGEDRRLTPGDGYDIVTYRGWRIRLITCYDLRFPVWCRNRTHTDGSLDYDLLLVVANWPRPRITAWRALLQARAIENVAYVIGVNRIGSDPFGTDYSGESLAYDYLGRPICEAEPYADQLLSATLEREPLEAFRQKFPVWRDSDTFTTHS